MAIAICARCDKQIDLDWFSTETIYINDEAICDICATDEELEEYEKH
jgi:hypothetical protein